MDILNIKIMVAAHKPYWMPTESCYLPVHVGHALHPGTNLGFIGDDTGDNISAKNPHYCELTAIYWAWKNLVADYVGLVHYRRYFTRREARDVEARKNEILTAAEWEGILADFPIVVPKKRRYYIETNRSHYNHAHHPDGLDCAEHYIRVAWPEYLPAFERVMNRTGAHMFNMFVMRKDLFDDYCTWLFEILAAVETRVDLTGWDAYESRIYGFVSELLLDVWLEKNGIAYREQNVSFLEPQDWLKKGGAFLKRKFLSGNKKYGI